MNWLDKARKNGLIVDDRPARVEVEELPLSLSETEFEKIVVAYAQSLGWRAMAVRRNVCVKKRNSGDTYGVTPWLYDGKGFPDLTLVRDRVIFVECKAEKGRLTAEQKVWRDRLLSAGQNWLLWRPRNWQAIKATLKREV